MADYYALLEVDRTATAADISASWRRLARTKHPDKNPDNPDATSLFQELQTAYSVLKDSASRREYNIRLKASDVQQEQLHLFRQRRHHHASASFFKYPPSPPSKPVWPDRPPPTDKKLEEEIRAARKDLRSQEKLVVALEKQLADQQDVIAALWNVTEEVEQMESKAKRKKAQLTAAHAWPFPQIPQSPHMRPMQPQRTISFAGPDGTIYYQNVPAVASPVQPDQLQPQVVADIAAQLERLAAATDKLQQKKCLIQADLEKATLKTRRVTAEIQKATERKAHTESKLRELSRRWRIHHFGTDRAASENDDKEDSDDTGFDMWAAWGDEEGSGDGEPEWPACDVDPSWDEHQPYYDDIRYNAGGDEDEEEESWDGSAKKKEKETDEKRNQHLVDIGVDDSTGPAANSSQAGIYARGAAPGNPREMGELCSQDKAASWGSLDDHPADELEEPWAENPSAATVDAHVQNVWDTYKSQPTACVDAVTSETASAETDPPKMMKPKTKPEINVWAAQDGDLIDLGGGDEDEAEGQDWEEHGWEAASGGAPIGEMPRRWYANGQAAHDPMRRDGWDEETWQQSHLHEW